MTISEANEFVAILASRFDVGDYSDNMFDYSARQSQLDAIRDRYLAYQSQTSSATQVQEIASVLKTTPLTAVTTSGAVFVPINTLTDYLYLDSLSYVRAETITRLTRTTICNIPATNTTTTTNAVTDIDVVLPNRLAARGFDLVATATLEYPVCGWDNQNRLRILPASMSGKTIDVRYYSIPEPPSVIDGTNFTLPESCHTELCVRILKYLSVSLKSVPLAQLMQQIQQPQ
jgi:hypothetical protein